MTLGEPMTCGKPYREWSTREEFGRSEINITSPVATTSRDHNEGVVDPAINKKKAQEFYGSLATGQECFDHRLYRSMDWLVDRLIG